MSNQSSQPTQTRAARSKAAPAKRRAKEKPPTPPARSTPKATREVPRPATRASADVEAQRALLADPVTIATGKKQPARTERTPRAASAPKPGPAKPGSTPAPPPSPSPRTALLDATRAQRLAREAHLRERDSREALARAREALEGPPPVPTPEQASRAKPGPIAPTAQWQRHPLAPPTRIQSDADPVSPPSARPAPLAAERALAAELREARSTLAIARETTQVQRDEIARLRSALARAQSASTAPIATAQAPSTALVAERDRLEERVRELELTLAQREHERDQLLEAVGAREREQSDRGRELAALQDRFDVQEQALDQARRQFELERRRHTEAQATLDRLRAALRSAEEESAPAAPAATATDAAASVVTIAHAAPIAVPPAVPSTSIQDESRRAGLFRAPIFELWREGQIRRHFGPLGLDTSADLLRDPLARRQRAGGPTTSVLMIGAGAAPKAASLSAALTRSGLPRFVLHVADPLSPIDGRWAPAQDTDEGPRLHPVPESAAELETLVRKLSPGVILVRDFLTTRRDVEPWLDVLARATRAGACLVLLEETGRGTVVPGDEIETIGQRIWELLPERYTRDPVTETPVASFREAFGRRVALPRNGLLPALRSRFELELCAQFGFLAEAFVSGPIAGCFDPEAARDRRFLEQITDLDDRRVEAGNTAALHLIARIDPLAPR